MTAILPIAPTPDLGGPSHEAGLGGLIALVEGVEQAFPLSEVVVRTAIVADCARTVVEQRFENPFSQPLEAVHLFPLPEDGAVVEVELKAGEMTVRAECREREAAEKAFAEARDAGHRAALLTAERADVHTLRVTRIPPGEEVRVRIVVVERLEKVDGRYRWRFPTVIPPRYLPGDPVSHRGDGVLPATDRVPDADRLQPPVRLNGGTSLDLEVEIQGPVRNLQCAQHAFRIDLDGAIRVAPAADTTLDRDFVLAFATAEADAMVSRAWTDGTHTLVAVEPPSVALPKALPRDAVFVVDISGSMSGVKMRAAKLALKSAVHGLAPGDRFRMIAFDDRVEAMSPDLLAYDEGTLARADAWIGALDARGGTEMLPAIAEALKGDDVVGRSRSVLFITDGQAWNEAELTAAVANRRKGARFFTFGIDTAVNGALLKRLARVGGGTCELCTPSDDIEEALASLEARFGNPVLENVRVDGLPAARFTGEAVFTGRPATLLIEGAPASLTVRGQGPDGEQVFTVEPKRLAFPIGALWGRERVAALEDRLVLKPFEEEALRPEIVRVALQYGIASRFTSFVAVDTSRVVEGELKTVIQPAEAPHAWDMMSGGAPPPAGAMPPPMAMPAPMPSQAPARYPNLGSAAGGRASGDAAIGNRKAAPRRMQDAKPAPGGVLGRIADALFGGAVDKESAPKGFAASEEASFDLGEGAAPPAPPPPPKMARELYAPSPEPDASAAPPSSDAAGDLARSQSADGSFGGDVARTAAALLALVLLGNTRRTGSRRRTVAKAAQWLQAHASDPLAALALKLLAEAESGAAVTPGDAWAPLFQAGTEGRALQQAAQA
ncbi:MAG: VWA domain-containing protein [Alphaproteobacteria bacterium]|nr:VWA domain-containing protein [Alphaproteobacteria bacterium]